MSEDDSTRPTAGETFERIVRSSSSAMAGVPASLA